MEIPIRNTGREETKQRERVREPDEVEKRYGERKVKHDEAERGATRRRA